MTAMKRKEKTVSILGPGFYRAACYCYICWFKKKKGDKISVPEFILVMKWIPCVKVMRQDLG